MGSLTTPAADVEADAAARSASRGAGRVWSKLCKWLMVSVLFGSLPLIFRWLAGFAGGQTTAWSGMLAGGELYMMASLLAATGLAELLFDWRPQGSGVQVGRAVVAVFAVIIVGTGAFMFNQSRPGEGPPENFVLTSVIVFAMAIVVSACCVALSEFRGVDHGH